MSTVGRLLTVLQASMRTPPFTENLGPPRWISSSVYAHVDAWGHSAWARVRACTGRGAVTSSLERLTRERVEILVDEAEARDLVMGVRVVPDRLRPS